MPMHLVREVDGVLYLIGRHTQSVRAVGLP